MNRPVALRRAALLARIGAAGPEGATLAELLEDLESAHLAALRVFLPRDPAYTRALQAQTLRNDLKFIEGWYDFRLPAIERSERAWRLRSAP